MNRFFELSFSKRFVAGHLEPVAEMDRFFPEVVRQSHFRLWTPGIPISSTGTRILIGIATWSQYDLRLLDVIDASLAQQNGSEALVEVFNIDGLSVEDLSNYIPGLAWVHHPPVVGIWINGALAQTASGFAGRDLVARIFGSSSNDITQFVTEQRSTASTSSTS